MNIHNHNPTSRNTMDSTFHSPFRLQLIYDIHFRWRWKYVSVQPRINYSHCSQGLKSVLSKYFSISPLCIFEFSDFYLLSFVQFYARFLILFPSSLCVSFLPYTSFHNFRLSVHFSSLSLRFASVLGLSCLLFIYLNKVYHVGRICLVFHLCMCICMRKGACV